MYFNDQEKKIREALEALQDRETPTPQEIASQTPPPGMEERLLFSVRQEMDKRQKEQARKDKKQILVRRVLATAALLILVFSVGFRKEIAEFVARFTITDYGTHLDVNHTAEVTGDTDFSKVTYSVPDGYALTREYCDITYNATWEKGSSMIDVSIRELGGCLSIRRKQLILVY